MNRPDTTGLLRKLDPVPIPPRPAWALNNPFAAYDGVAWVQTRDAESRIEAVRGNDRREGFTVQQCTQVLAMPFGNSSDWRGVQKSVRQAAEVRLRKLEREGKAS